MLRLSTCTSAALAHFLHLRCCSQGYLRAEGSGLQSFGRASGSSCPLVPAGGYLLCHLRLTHALLQYCFLLITTTQSSGLNTIVRSCTPQISHPSAVCNTLEQEVPCHHLWAFPRSWTALPPSSSVKRSASEPPANSMHIHIGQNRPSDALGFLKVTEHGTAEALQLYIKGLEVSNCIGRRLWSSSIWSRGVCGAHWTGDMIRACFTCHHSRTVADKLVSRSPLHTLDAAGLDVASSSFGACEAARSASVHPAILLKASS